MRYLNWRYIFFVNLPIGMIGLMLVYMYLPDFRDKEKRPLDIVGLIMFGAGIALLSYVLEVFGDHSLSTLEIFGLIGGLARAARRLRALRGADRQPAARFGAVSRSLVHRFGRRRLPSRALAWAACRSCYRCSTKSGWATRRFNRVCSSCRKRWQRSEPSSVLPPILIKFGYRTVLIANTFMIGALIISFATISLGTPPWVIIVASTVPTAFFSRCR